MQYERGHHPNSRKGLELGRAWNKGLSKENGDQLSYGKPRSKQTRQRIALALKGRKKTAEHRAALSAARLALFDKRGRKPIRSTNRNRAYGRWMRAVKERDGHKCVWCGATENLHVDHIKSFALHPDLRYEISNGRVLCAPCHRKTPTYGVKSAVLKVL